MSDYGSAEIRRTDDGHLIVVSADEVIGISVELLAEALGGAGLWVDDGTGLLWLAGDPNYRYRPIRFTTTVHGLDPNTAMEGSRFVVCERVR